MEIGFKDIKFGFADASVEAQHEPDLLTDAFYDATELAESIWKSGRHFMLLGLKGMGKSAVAWHLQLTAAKSSNKFANLLELQDFPFGAFAKVKVDENDGIVRYVETWKYLIYVKLLYLVNQDQSLKKNLGSKFDKLISQLTEIGVLPGDDLSVMVMQAKKQTRKATLSDIFSSTFGFGVGLGVAREVEFAPMGRSTLIQLLEMALNQVSSQSEFRIIIDGLDDCLINKQERVMTLTALVRAVKRVNEVLRSSELDAKVILLIRSDLYDKLSEPNLNKLQCDHAKRMEWYDEASPAAESKLFQLVNLRGKLAVGHEVNVVKTWLPSKIDGQGVEKYLLNLTRHRPRDVIQLFNSLQECAGVGMMTEAQVRKGVSLYAQSYLLREIKDELSGLLDDALVKHAFDLIFSIRKPKFRLSDACAQADRFNIDYQGVLEILEHLFDCGAIGLIDDRTQINLTTFKYRTPAAVFSSNSEFVIHKGLQRAANLERVL